MKKSLILVICLACLMIITNGCLWSTNQTKSGSSGAKQISLTSDSLYKAVNNNETATYHVTIHNDSGFDRPIRITGTPAAGNWVVTYYDPITGTDITSQIISDGFLTPAITATGSYTVQLEVMPISVTPGSSMDTSLTGSFVDAPQEKDDIEPTTRRILKPTLIASYNNIMSPTNVCVLGNYAYWADGYSLLVIDVSDPASPTLAGSCDNLASPQLIYPMPNCAVRIYVSGNYAYVAVGSSGLRIVDISNPATPTLAGICDTPGLAVDVHVSGNYAYVADVEGGLQVIDISNQAAPTLAGSYGPGSPSDGGRIYISGNYAYWAVETAGVRIMDISNPVAPILTGLYSDNIWLYSPASTGIQSSGDYVYIASIDKGMQVINVSSPASPTFLSSYNPTPTEGLFPYPSGTLNTWDVYISGNYAYVAYSMSSATGYGGSLQVVDISNPATPVFAGVHNLPEYSGAEDVYVSGDYAYVVNMGAGILYIIRLTD